jgi:hypothetical protein
MGDLAPEGTMQKTLKSYFFWTHQRGSFHYDVMVTLILAFIFITPMPFMHGLINYGDKAPTSGMLVEPISVVGDGQYGLILTVPAQIIQLDPTADIKVVRKALHQAIQPVTGDAVSVVRWETVSDSTGKPTAWKVWVHR